jgi:hypothetical protein
MKRFIIEWLDAGKKPQCEPDPAYPDGIDLDVTDGKKPSCKVILPYPANQVGAYLIDCTLCGMAVACTTAGRADDPRSILIPCRLQ